MSIAEYALIGSAAFFISTIAGLSGYGAGLLMPFVLIPIMGPQGVVPILAVAALFNNASRLAAFRDRIYWQRAFHLMITAIPGCLLGASAYTLLSGPGVMLMIGIVLLVIIPARRLLRNRPIGTSRAGALAAGAVYGVLIGGATGAGVILIPILLGMGLRGRSVIATDSLVSFVVGLFKVATFQTLGFLPWDWWVCALVIGISGVPGAFVARWLADRMAVHLQDTILDVGVAIGGVVLVLRGLGYF